MSPALAWTVFTLGLLFMLVAAILKISEEEFCRRADAAMDQARRYLTEGERAWTEAKTAYADALVMNADTKRLLDSAPQLLAMPARRKLDA